METEGDSRFAQDILFKRLMTSGCGRGASLYSAVDAASQRVESQMRISADEVSALANEFQHSSEVYLATHGVHSAALSDNKSILVFADDLARHNAIDRIFGQCLLEDIPTADRVVITSGRISSEILHKVAKKSVPVIISISVPTNLAVRAAEAFGIPLIGSVRGKRINIYTHDWRVGEE